MTQESQCQRPRSAPFLTLGAAAGAGVVTAGLAEPAIAGGAPEDGPAKGSTPLMIQAKPLPEKVCQNRSRRDQQEDPRRRTIRSIRAMSARSTIFAPRSPIWAFPIPTKANATYSDLRELKVEYSFALGGVKNHELYFNNIGGKGGEPTA